MSSRADDLVARYLARLQDELRNVPASGRQEVVQEIAEHIHAARAELGDETEVDVRNILDRVGDPLEIAADARERFGVRERGSNWREVAALILLPFGGIVIPFAGWFVGVFFLWVSDVWTRREKLLGTFVVPFGLLGPVLLLGLGASTGRRCSGVVGGPLVCKDGTDSMAVVMVVLFALMLAATIAVLVYLATRLRGRKPS